MTESIIVATITGCLTLIGSVITTIITNSKTSHGMIEKLDKQLAITENKLDKQQKITENKLDIQQAITETKLDDLTREVREHNNFALRIPVVEEQIKVINHRIDNLERSGNNGN